MKLAKKIGTVMPAAALFTAAAAPAAFAARLEDVSVQFSVGEPNDYNLSRRLTVLPMEKTLYYVRQRCFYPVCRPLYQPAKPLPYCRSGDKAD